MNPHSRIYRGVIGGNMNRKTVVMMALSLILILCVFVGCDNSTADKLAGTWKYSYDNEFGKGYVELKFDGMGHFSVSYFNDGEDLGTDHGIYYIKDDFINMVYDYDDDGDNYKAYVKKVNEGTDIVYYFAYTTENEPPVFDDVPYTCEGGDFRGMIQEEKYPIMLTYREIDDELNYKYYDYAAYYSDMYYATAAVSKYDANGSLLYGFEESAKARMEWNDPSQWSWNAEGVSSSPVYILRTAEDVVYGEMIKYSLNGKTLSLWWDYEDEEMSDFIKQ